MNIQLALQVRRSILREPDTFRMNNFFQDIDESAWIYKDNPALRCGTVACIAGHTLACSGRLSLKEAYKKHGNTEGNAAEDLELSDAAALKLFYPWHEPVYGDIITTAELHPAGTPEYAAEAVKLIDHCVRLNATEIEQAAYFAQIGG